MAVTELRPGLWRWTAPHPAWIEGADWPREVGCVYYEAPGAVVLIDPLVPPEREGFFRALDRDLERADRPLAILLTVPWHERSAEEVAERYGTALDGLPRGIVPLSFPEVGETIYWLPEHGALVPGVTLLGEMRDGLPVCPDRPSGKRYATFKALST